MTEQAKITFKFDTNRGDIERSGRLHLASRSNDIKGYMEHGTEWDEVENAEDAATFFEESGPFHEYALAFDYVAPGTFTDAHEGYLRYQISCGGPSEEVRFYVSPGDYATPYKVEFVYLDWGVGIGFDVKGEDWAQWLWAQFSETESVQPAIEQALQVWP